MNHFGGTIYALRKSRYLTQEQLADYFEVSVDELLGRNRGNMTENGNLYSEANSLILNLE